MEPILTEEDFEQLHNRKVIKGYSKHGYKYRHKIYINGEVSYMTTKKKKTKFINITIYRVTDISTKRILIK